MEPGASSNPSVEARRPQRRHACETIAHREIAYDRTPVLGRSARPCASRRILCEFAWGAKRPAWGADHGRGAAITTCVRWGARLDGVVNNAAIADPHAGGIEALSIATWQRYLDVNLTSAFLVVKHAVRHLRRTRGAIVNLGSTRALQSEPDTEPYAACKGAIVALSHALAMSLGPAIRVNCISPGWIATDELAPHDRRRSPRLRRADHAQHPVGRVGRPDDIAHLCAWLPVRPGPGSSRARTTCPMAMTRKMIYV